MKNDDQKKVKTGIRPESISRFRKERFLRSMTEDQFRDQVVRPLFLRKGLKDGRDLCGIDEEGKDCIFVGQEQLGYKVIYAVQTKKGNINLTKKASQSLIEAKTQLLTSLETPVTFVETREKLLPTYVILAANGKINMKARNHIIENVKQPHVRFMDIDSLIPDIDQNYSELWLGIDADKFPYLKKLKDTLIGATGEYPLSELLPPDSGVSSVSDGMFVNLYLNRSIFKIVKKKGKIIKEPKFEEFPGTSLLNRKEGRFLILGEAGSGKSTLLKRLAYVLSDDALKSGEQISTPILLRASDISKSNKSILDICNDTTSKLTLSSKSAFTVNDLRNGEVTVFVDALDEVPNNSKRQDVLKRVLAFSDQYPECKIVLSSRDYSFVEELEELHSFVQFRLSPIDWKQTASIIRKLHHGKKLKKETLQEYLRRLQDVHGIELNPLLVTVFVATSDYSRKDIPANITELFKKYTEMMLGRWDLSKGISQQFHAPLKDFLLRKMAFEMHRRGLTQISQQECRDIFIKELESRGRSADIEQLLEECYRSGLFRFSEDMMEFRHLLLQEFFAGRGIPILDFLSTEISDPWWQRAILFYFGEHPDDHHALESIIKNVSFITPEELFNAAIAVGLALQACYLVKMKHKLKIFIWVIESLSNSRELYITEHKGKQVKFPLMRFISYYIFGRDAVACDVLSESYQELLEEIKQGDFNPEDREVRHFWTIIGLIESGLLEQAFKEVKIFKPADYRFYLAIHLGCFLVAQLRVFEKKEKKIAETICNYLNPKIAKLRKQIFEEMKTELLELQKGRIKAIEHFER
jgi:energy-coupling factor transporter ATP-binding protein EcfA2